MVKFQVIPENIPNEGITFADHESVYRSGHLSHALVEYAPGKVLAFYSNCDPERNNGHNGYGWIEYRRSTDGARSWGEPVKLPYSVTAFENGEFTVSCEKAVSPGENEIVLFCTRCINPNGWEPYLIPTVLKSTDGGETWQEKGELCSERGRIYDAIYVDGRILVLQSCNPAEKEFWIYDESQSYRIWQSTDGGESFVQQGIIPGDVMKLAYGTMEINDKGELMVWLYNIDDEFNLNTYISSDYGRTWNNTLKSFCAKRIRNPQIAKVKGGYILHGRSGCMDYSLPMEFVLYTSEDGINWDEGIWLAKARGSGGASFYSNNLVLNEGDRQRVLIQSSIAYSAARTNIAHWMLEME